MIFFNNSKCFAFISTTLVFLRQNRLKSRAQDMRESWTGRCRRPPQIRNSLAPHSCAPNGFSSHYNLSGKNYRPRFALMVSSLSAERWGQIASSSHDEWICEAATDILQEEQKEEEASLSDLRLRCDARSVVQCELLAKSTDADVRSLVECKVYSVLQIYLVKGSFRYSWP